MKHLKLFEEFEEPTSGFMSVPPDINKRIDMLAADTKQKAEVYGVPKNQMKIDLFYGLKSAIKDYIDDSKRNFIERSHEEYEKRLNNEIDGILYKFSKGKYNNIAESDVSIAKEILWEEINKTIPYDEVDYFHTYDLQGKLLKLLETFMNRITETEGIFYEE